MGTSFAGKAPVMNTVFHPASARGHADHGWLDTHHSFSFGGWYDPSRVHFGALRVLNDDHVAGGAGFGRHPHDNMEIVSIPLAGDLVHRDSMGNEAVIREGDVQVMSAGTGIEHSEANGNTDRAVDFLQIWIIPRERGVAPRYDQRRIPDGRNTLHQILSPDPADDGVWVHQDAWFHWGRLDAGFRAEYALHGTGQGLYAFLLDGRATVAGVDLGPRDAVGITDADRVPVEVHEDGRLLLIEVPMALSHG